MNSFIDPDRGPEHPKTAKNAFYKDFKTLVVKPFKQQQSYITKNNLS